MNKNFNINVILRSAATKNLSFLLLRILIILILISQVLFSQQKISGFASEPGAFSRMGFGARGIGMGNAMSAVTTGNLVSYYNPALTVFQDGNSFQTSYSFLSLDRSLNFLNFTKKFDFYSKKDSLKENREPRSTAGVTIGIINSGVSKIDGRDNNGLKTGDLSTSENQFFVGLANKFSKKFSLGINAKVFYYKLYDKVKSSGFGLDVGALYVVNDQYTISFVVSDINSKYKWDTAPIYGQDGTTTTDKFPMLMKAGVGYRNKELKLTASAEFERSDVKTNIMRIGIEYNIYKNLFLRGGLDQFDLSNSDSLAKPALGFSYSQTFDNIVIGIDYAFMIEQYSPQDRHVVGLNVNF